MLAEKASYNSLEIKKIIPLISKYCRSEIGEEAAFAAAPAQKITGRKRENFHGRMGWHL